MIIKGNRHRNGTKLARYLMGGGLHERVELAELWGFGPYSDDIFKAFRALHVVAAGAGIQNPLFHVQVRLPDREEITRQQWQRTADRIEKRLGLTGQARAAVFHIDDKTGELHLHLAFSLIDTETLKARQLPFFKFRLKTLARELEKEFDITRVKNEREGPIKYAARKNEQQQAQRLGVDKDEIRNTIRACWDQSDCGRSFEAALAHEGMILSQGDRRGLVVVDRASGVHALGKRILGVNKSQILERLADLDLNELPSVQQAQSFIRDIAAEPPRQKPPSWNSDHANQVWEDAVINAAIANDRTAGEFVEGTPEPETVVFATSRSASSDGGQEAMVEEPRAGQPVQRQQETHWSVNPPQPEPVQVLWPPPRFEDQPDRGDDGTDHSVDNGTVGPVSLLSYAGPIEQPVSAPIRDPRAADRSPTPRSFAGAIRLCQGFGGHVKQLFHDVKNVLTGNSERAPEVKRKRRKEDTRGLFKRACAILRTTGTECALFRLAGRILHRAPPLSVTHAGVDYTPWDMPPDHDKHAEYLRLLEVSEQEDFNPQHENGGFHHAESDHLSLHL